ncbi:hypothetical protein CP03DC29_1112A, partial [Chlamydia psittaci 03DC29]
MTHLNYEKSQL